MDAMMDKEAKLAVLKDLMSQMTDIVLEMEGGASEEGKPEHEAMESPEVESEEMKMGDDDEMPEDDEGAGLKSFMEEEDKSPKKVGMSMGGSSSMPMKKPMGRFGK